MQRIRVIPVLLLKGNGLYKTVKFRNPQYIGDPMNVVRIFNEKEVDELCFLDISATSAKKEINYKIISEIASECFMPLSYGGGINSMDQIKKLFNIGVEKVIINSAAHANTNLISEASAHFGSQSIVGCIDIKKNFLGKYEVHIESGEKNTSKNPVDFAKELQEMGAGEILVNSIDRDGTMKGYDIELVNKISTSLKVPVIACGGAGSIEDLSIVIKEGSANAVAAGSMFVFHGKHKAVLISYPSQIEIKKISI
jgi:cyclase